MLVYDPLPPDAMALHDVSRPVHWYSTPTSPTFLVGHATLTAGFTVMGHVMVTDACDASVTVMVSDCVDGDDDDGVHSTRPVDEPMVGGATML